MPMPYLKQYIRLISYQKSEKSMVWLPKRARKRIFHTFFAIFGPKKNFLAKLPMPYLKQYIRLVTYQKIRKIYGVVAKKCSKMHIFHTFFAIFGQFFFFSKIQLRQFFGTIESYLDTKNQKKLWSGSSGIHPGGRTHGRTDARTYESKSIVPPKFFGSVQKKVHKKLLKF